MDGTIPEKNTTSAVNQQLEKNRVAIEKLNNELNVLRDKITEGEQLLENTRELMKRYDEISERIVTLNKKIKMSANVPQKISALFESLIREAEMLEHSLAKKGIRSVEDFNRLVKIIRDNKEMYSKYNEMVENIQKQNEYYMNVALQSIESPELVAKKNFKMLIAKLKDEYNLHISKVEQLRDEINEADNKIKALLRRQSIAQDIYEKLRAVEQRLVRFEKCKERLSLLNNDFLDENGKVKDSSQYEFFMKQKESFEKMMRMDIDFLRENNVLNMFDFEQKDYANGNEMKALAEEIDFYGKKLGLLKQVLTEYKKISGN